MAEKLHAFHSGTSESGSIDKRRIRKRTLAQAHAIDRGTFVLSEKQYKHFQACMASPNQPTAKMRAAAAEMREFHKKSR